MNWSAPAAVRKWTLCWICGSTPYTTTRRCKAQRSVPSCIWETAPEAHSSGMRSLHSAGACPRRRQDAISAKCRSSTIYLWSHSPERTARLSTSSNIFRPCSRFPMWWSTKMRWQCRLISIFRWTKKRRKVACQKTVPAFQNRTRRLFCKKRQKSLLHKAFLAFHAQGSSVSYYPYPTIAGKHLFMSVISGSWKTIAICLCCRARIPQRYSSLRYGCRP